MTRTPRYSDNDPSSMLERLGGITLQEDFEDVEDDYEDDEDDARRMAACDECHDGFWLADGFNGMMIRLSEPDFLEEQYEEIRSDGGNEYDIDRLINIPHAADERELRRMQQILESRNLVIASVVIRRIAEGLCPPQIAIQRVPEEDMAEIRSLKENGNRAFASGHFEKAIEFYEDALMLFSFEMFIAPKDQMAELVNILSNRAQCELNLERYDDAGQTATEAILLDCDHEKSRIRRAKAELALAAADRSNLMAIQAVVDLRHVLENPESSPAGIKLAQNLMKQAASAVEKTKKALLEKHPTLDWDLYMRDMASRCW